MASSDGRQNAGSFKSIENGFETLQEVEAAIRQAGLEACELIVGVDFTKSNTWTGKNSFDGASCSLRNRIIQECWPAGRNLHDVTGPENPYMKAFRLIANMLKPYDDDRKIPCYGFGDITTGRNTVFSFFPNDEPAQDLEQLVTRYKQIVPSVLMSGPTTFAPLIRQAMRVVDQSGMKYHVLVILADGQITMQCLDDTTQAIVDASEFPMSIVMIGVGDGPWDEMKHFDDKVPQRNWDNFQFIEFNEVINNPAMANSEDIQQNEFALLALMELPKQYEQASRLTGEARSGRVRSILEGIPDRVVIDPPH